MDRRELLSTAAAIGAGSILTSESVQAAEQHESTQPSTIVDTNVSLFRWPFRSLPLDKVDALVARLKALSVRQAWAGSFEGLLHRDIAGVNARLFLTCRSHAALIPVGSINPTLPDWQRDLRQCLQEYKMHAIRLHPNYHGYTLADPRFEELLKLASTAGRLIQIAVAMEDRRTQHPLVHVADVDLSPLPGLLKTHQGARVQLLNYRPKAADLESLGECSQLFFDTSRVDGTDGISKLIKSVSPERIMFGTHAPFLIPEAATIRITESHLSAKEQALLMNQTAGVFL